MARYADSLLTEGETRRLPRQAALAVADPARPQAMGLLIVGLVC